MAISLKFVYLTLRSNLFIFRVSFASIIPYRDFPFNDINLAVAISFGGSS